MTTTESSGRAVRAIAFAVLALVLCCFGAIQFASDSLYAEAAAPHAFPSWIPKAFGMNVYRVLDRVAPAAYVESTLARSALQAGDTDRAWHYAVRLPAGAVRDGLLEQVAAARGETTLAFEYAFAAPDIAGVQTLIERMRIADPRGAYALEERFIARLDALQTHPDAVARGWWTLGTIAAQTAAPAWQTLAYRDYVKAAHLAPLDLTNVLGAANQAVTLRQWRDAQAWYRRALDVSPGNADAVAGLGIVDLQSRGDRKAAEQQLSRAAAADPSSALVRELQRELRARP